MKLRFPWPLSRQRGAATRARRGGASNGKSVRTAAIDPPRVFALGWVGLSVLAMAYLTSLSMGSHADTPDGQVAALAVDQSLDGSDASARDPNAKLNVDLANAVAALTSEMVALKTVVSDLKQSERSLNARLTTLQEALGPTTAAVSPSSKPSSTKPAMSPAGIRSAAPPPDPSVSSVTVPFLPLPADGFGDAAAKSSPVPVAKTTAAEPAAKPSKPASPPAQALPAPAAPTPAPAARMAALPPAVKAPPPTQTLFGVEVATADSPAVLQAEWLAVKSQHGDLLKNLDIRRASGTVVDASGTRTTLRLIAGPFKNAVDAARLCAKLRAVAANCVETVFEGEAL